MHFVSHRCFRCALMFCSTQPWPALLRPQQATCSRHLRAGSLERAADDNHHSHEEPVLVRARTTCGPGLQTVCGAVEHARATRDQARAPMVAMWRVLPSLHISRPRTRWNHCSVRAVAGHPVDRRSGTMTSNFTNKYKLKSQSSPQHC